VYIKIPGHRLSDLIRWGPSDKLDKMCHLVTEQYMKERDLRRIGAIVKGPCPENCGFEGPGACFHISGAVSKERMMWSNKYEEKNLRRWLLRKFPMMTKELREDVCECAVQNYAFERSDPRKYS